MLQPFWTGGTPSLQERTHVWDVSGTRWEEYDKGTKLTSPTFSCAGVDGLHVEFYPEGNWTASVYLKIAPEHDIVMAAFRITVHEERYTWPTATVTWEKVQQLNRVHNSVRRLSNLAPRKITVELLDVKRSYHQRKKSPEEVTRVKCAPGDCVWVTACAETARQSFYVVGSQHSYASEDEKLLGQRGEVLEVTQLTVKVKHDSGVERWWGHEALSLALTAAEVDALKVRSD